MKLLLKGVAGIFHPILIPIIASLAYFKITPKFIPENFLYAKLLALSILTVFVPVLFYFLLKNLGLTSNAVLQSKKERKILLGVQLILSFIIVLYIINGYEFLELYYFFIGIIISTFLSWIALFWNIKLSQQMVAVCSLLLFIVGLSISYTKNLLLILAALSIVLGIVVSYKIIVGNRTNLEIVLGAAVGIVAQVILWPFWL